MPHAVRRAVIGALFVLLASWAWLPVFQSGLHGREAALAHQFAASGSALHFLANDGHAWFGLRTLLPGPALLVRLEAALWLLLAAFALGRTAHRLLLPWSGGELARAAGWATSLFLAVHPLSTAAIADASARGNLIALALGACATWSYLFARQEREPRGFFVAGACTILAAFAGDFAFSLPAWLAGAEFLSANRQRKSATRARSAAATVVAALVAVSLPVIVHALAYGDARVPSAIASVVPESARSLERGVFHAFERFGTLLLPVNSHTIGAWGFALAGVLALAVLQPILIAARSAPRLWGRILGIWAVALLVAEALGPSARVHPGDLRDAAALLGAVAVVSVGLGLGSVAVSGSRRVVLPLVMGLGLAVLSHSGASAHRAAARELAAIEAALAGSKAPVAWVIDPPDVVLGVRCAEGALDARRAVGLTREAAALRALEGDFSGLRSARLDLVRRGESGWSSTSLAVATPSTGASDWFREGRSPELDLDPLESQALVVRATAEADTSRAPVLAWRTTTAEEGGTNEAGRVEGAWAYLGEAPEAVFDLASSLDWLASERVRQVWSVEGWSRITQAEFLERLPQPALAGDAQLAGDRFSVRLSVEGEGADERREWWLRAQVGGRAVEVKLERNGDELSTRFGGLPEGLGTLWIEARIGGRAVERGPLQFAR
ncbi:MAG: hypothetical protein NTV21_13040 [Planctomycetota bacterium]|nr:hypothetical protein [Planctomycetota bacterium]